jgi:hypothetical protein
LPAPDLVCDPLVHWKLPVGGLLHSHCCSVFMQLTVADMPDITTRHMSAPAAH